MDHSMWRYWIEMDQSGSMEGRDPLGWWSLDPHLYLDKYRNGTQVYNYLKRGNLQVMQDWLTHVTKKTFEDHLEGIGDPFEYVVRDNHLVEALYQALLVPDLECYKILYHELSQTFKNGCKGEEYYDCVLPPLHLAVQHTRFPFVQWLVVDGSHNVNQVHPFHGTPLHCLLEANWCNSDDYDNVDGVSNAVKIGRLLLQHGADVEQRNIDDKTILELAISQKKLELLTFLLKECKDLVVTDQNVADVYKSRKLVMINLFQEYGKISKDDRDDAVRADLVENDMVD
jgi:Ankyrin repeats (3 copies)